MAAIMSVKDHENYIKNKKQNKGIQSLNNYSYSDKPIMSSLNPPIANAKTNNSVGNNLKYIGKSAETGVVGGVTNIYSALSTDIANNFQKGAKKSTGKAAKNLGKKLLTNGTFISLPYYTYKGYKELDKNIKQNKDKNLFQNVVKTGMNLAKTDSILDAAIQLASAALPEKTSNKVSKKLLKSNEIVSKPVNSLQEDLNNMNVGTGTKIVGGAVQSIGNMLPAIAVSAATENPELAATLSLSTMGLSAKGSTTNEQLKQGKSLNDAVKRGNVDASIEIGTEMLTGGLKIFGKGTLDDAAEAGIKKLAKTKLQKELLQRGYQVGGEVLEETISDVLNSAIDYSEDSNVKYGLKDWGKTAAATVLSTVGLNLLTGGYAGGLNMVNQNIGVNEYAKQKGLSKQQVNNEINKEIENRLPFVKKDNVTSYSEDKQLRNTIKNDILNEMNSGNYIPTQDRGKQFTYKATDNEKVNTMLQSIADKGYTNTQQTHNLAQTAEKLIRDLDVNVRILNNEDILNNALQDYANNDGITYEVAKDMYDKGLLSDEEIGYRDNINGYKVGNDIVLNADSKELQNFVLGHEITHFLEKESDLYKAVQDSLFELSEMKKLLQDDKASIEKRYRDVINKEITKKAKEMGRDLTQPEIDEIKNEIINTELTADYVGQFFTDDNFIQKLGQKPGMLQKLLEFLEKLYYNITGKEEKAKILDAKNKINDLYTKYAKNKTEAEIKANNIQYSLNDYDEYQNETKAKIQEIRDTVGDDFANNLENQINEYKEKHPLEYKIREFTKSRDAKNINDEFFKEHVSDYDKNSGTNTQDGRVTVLHLQKGNNLAKVSFTENPNKIWIDELYVKNQKQGYGSEIVNAIKEYANEQGKDVEAFKELSTAKGFWDKTLNRNTKYSLSEKPKQDNQGNKVAPGMQKYMSDSKARVDEDLNKPLVRVYHGSNKAGFTEFNRNYNFYVDSEDVANSYTSSSEKVDTKKLESINDAKSWLKGITDELYIENNSVYDYDGENIINYSNEQELLRNLKRDIQQELGGENAGGLYSGYVNITSPLIIEGDNNLWSQIPVDNIPIENAKELLNEQFYREMGKDKKNKLRTSTNDIVELAKNIGSYDGVIFKNIVDHGAYFHKKIDSKANVYVTFNSNQFKAVDNLNPTEDADIRYSLASTQDNKGHEIPKNLQVRMKDSKARDYEGRLKELYHGTATGEFYEFDMSRANPEGDWGAGIYLTDNESDVELNYEDGGSDFDNKIARLAEQIEQEEEIDYDEAKEKAKKQLYKGSYKITSYANITNPAIVGETYVFNPEDYYDNYNIDDYENEEDYYADIDQLVSDDIDEAIWNIEKTYDFYNGTDEIRNILWEAYYDGGMEIQKLKDKLGELYLETDEGIVGNDVARIIIESLGYDGIIDPTVSTKWNMDIEPGTTHYIAFKGNQIKDINNENPTDNPDIRLSIGEELSERYDRLYKPKNKSTDRLNDILPVNVPEEPKRAEEPIKNDKLNAIDKAVENKKYTKSSKAINEAVRTGDNYIDFTKKEKQQFKEALKKYENMSKEDLVDNAAEVESEIRNVVNQFATREANYTNENLSQLQKLIKGRTFKLPEFLESDIADFDIFKKNNRKNFKISRTDGEGLDVFYEDMVSEYPSFKGNDPDFMSETDILKKLANIMNEDTTIYDSYVLSNEEVNKYANKIFNKLIQNTFTDNDIDELRAKLNKNINQNITRHEAIERYRTLARENLGDLSQYTDKKRGFLYEMNTMKRNLRDIVSKDNKAQANKLYNEYFKPVTEHNATIEKQINKYNERFAKYDINKAESTYIQMLGEFKYNPETTLTEEEVNQFYDKNMRKIDKDKCEKVIEDARKTYDDLFEQMNEVLVNNGYKPIEYRKGYFPHFIEDKPTSIIGKMAEKLGWKVQKGTLPTDIAGITDMFTPGKAWTSFSQRRTGDATDYNFLKGYDNYIRGAMDLIYHTEDIQKLRALENEIRYQSSDEALQEKINAIYNDSSLDMEQKNEQIAELMNNKDIKLGNLVTQLRSYTNNLANKKNAGDRGMEEFFGRDSYSIMNNINSRVSANMVGANISSALTNFIPITQAWSQISTKNLMRGMYEAVKTTIKDDGFADNSTYLTNRTKQADRLFKTNLDKINQTLGIPFEAIDNFTSNVIVRGKYYDNLQKGMTEAEAMDNANEFAKDVMAGRSKGDQPTVFNKKNPVYKLFTAFQLEVNNQYGYMFKDLPLDLKDEALGKLALAYLKMFLGAYIYNYFAEKITGRKSAFSPIDMAVDDIKTVTDKDLDIADKVKAVGKDASQELPFVSGIVGGGRLPISGAIPYASSSAYGGSLIDDVSDLFDEKKKSKAIKSITKEFSKPIYYIAMPFAGGQIKKSVEGLQMYDKDLPVAGSYTDTGRLRFEADTSPLGKLQSAVFGQYASKNAREYFDKGQSPLTEKQIKEALDADLPISEYRQIDKGIKDAKAKAKKEERNQSEAMYDYIYDLPLSDNQKNSLINSRTKGEDTITDKNGYVKYEDKNGKTYWYDKNTDTVYNNKYKEIKSVDVSELNKYSTKKDISDYGNYGSLKEFNYANKNPKEYLTLTQITDYDTYNEYKDEIAAIKQNYSEAKTEIRKKKVFDYINSLPLNKYQKTMLYKTAGDYSINNYKKDIHNYINGLNLTKQEKQTIYDELISKEK